MYKLVTENQLDSWVEGNIREAQGVIVDFVCRLILASAFGNRIDGIHLPLSDSIEQPGPDASLQVDSTDTIFRPYVPEGKSFWEIGTGKKPIEKAKKDYKKSVESIERDIRLESTFVFVTPRSGRTNQKLASDKDDFIKNCLKEKEWKDIRIIDGTDLINWSSYLPSVQIRLAEKILHIREENLETIEQQWDLLSSIGSPLKLTPDLFLANRQSAFEEVKQFFTGNVAQLKITTYYLDQVIHFISACVMKLDEEAQKHIIGRSLIISGIREWRIINGLQKKHFLIAHPLLDLNSDQGTTLIQQAALSGNAILYAGLPGGVPHPKSVYLKEPQIHHIQNALEKSGYSKERSRVLAQKCAGNIPLLLRLIQNLSLLPKWAEESTAGDLAVIAFVGSWDDNHEADRTIMETLSGKAYGEWIGQVYEITSRPGTPLMHRDGKWKFILRYEGWYSLGNRLHKILLERLSTAAITVLKEKDPQFDLPADERFASQLYGKVTKHSSFLRNGLSEFLALLGSHPEALISCSKGKPIEIANKTVYKILYDSDWQIWASVNNLLPLLAEASPNVFLDSVENALRNEPCPFDDVFAQESNGVFGRIYTTGLLWALETLAWDEEYFMRVLMCLGELAARDPGGKYSNRPISSMTNILLPWFPQTCASIEKRFIAVESLLEELPEIGWKLLTNLLPHNYSSTSGTRKPEWRSIIPDDWVDGATIRERLIQEKKYSEIAVHAAFNNVDRLSELIDIIENLPPSAFHLIIKHLGSKKFDDMDETDRENIWTVLINTITKHRKFSDSNWAMNPKKLKIIENVGKKLAPKKPTEKYRRLFNYEDYMLYDEKGNYEKRQDFLKKERERAIKEIYIKGGVDSVIAFAETVLFPWRVGIAFSVIADVIVDFELLPSLLDSEKESLAHFIGGFILERFDSYGWKWFEKTVSTKWTPNQIGQFMSFLPFSIETWNRAENLLKDNELMYWNRTAIKPHESGGELETATKKLIQHGRPDAAVHCLSYMLHKKQNPNSDIKVQALAELLKMTKNENITNDFEIIELIKSLQEDENVDPDDLTKIEWGYLQLLDQRSHVTPKTLWSRLANEPNFFCYVIRLIYKSENGEVETKDLDDETKKRLARNAYRLLNEWRFPPGSQEDGSFDGNHLKIWIEKVKEECKETGHYDVAMSHVGNILKYVPKDPNGLWLHKTAAEVLNIKGADDIRKGFYIELYNSRGSHGDSEGKEERKLAEKYRRQANEVETAGYHRLAATLRDLANEYDIQAKRDSSIDPFKD